MQDLVRPPYTHDAEPSCTKACTGPNRTRAYRTSLLQISAQAAQVYCTGRTKAYRTSLPHNPNNSFKGAQAAQDMRACRVSCTSLLYKLTVQFKQAARACSTSCASLPYKHTTKAAQACTGPSLTQGRAWCRLTPGHVLSDMGLNTAHWAVHMQAGPELIPCTACQVGAP